MSILKPHDLLVLLKIVTVNGHWTIASLASEIYLSASETHAALVRAEQARLVNSSRQLNMRGLSEFVCHGAPYVYFCKRGELTRGMPTSTSAPPLVGKYFDQSEVPAVWPHPMGTVRGYSFEPLCKKAPDAAAADVQLYEFLALIDALREGNHRVKPLAIKEIENRFAAYKDREKSI